MFVQRFVWVVITDVFCDSLTQALIPSTESNINCNSGTRVFLHKLDSVIRNTPKYSGCGFRRNLYHWGHTGNISKGSRKRHRTANTFTNCTGVTLKRISWIHRAFVKELTKREDLFLFQTKRTANTQRRRVR